MLLTTVPGSGASSAPPMFPTDKDEEFGEVGFAMSGSGTLLAFACLTLALGAFGEAIFIVKIDD